MAERITNSGFVKRKKFFEEMKKIQTPGENAFGNGIYKEARKQAWKLINDKKDFTEVAWEQIRDLGLPV